MKTPSTKELHDAQRKAQEVCRSLKAWQGADEALSTAIAAQAMLPSLNKEVEEVKKSLEALVEERDQLKVEVSGHEKALRGLQAAVHQAEKAHADYVVVVDKDKADLDNQLFEHVKEHTERVEATAVDEAEIQARVDALKVEEARINDVVARFQEVNKAAGSKE